MPTTLPGKVEVTALLHAWMAGERRARAIRWQDRAHFFNMVSTLMRRVLVDAAREDVS